MSKIMDATIKINTEIQKVPDDSYRAVVGEYIIDRIKTEADGEKVLQEDKTLEKAMQHITDAAKKKAKGNTAVMRDDEVFALAMKYFELAEAEDVSAVPDASNNIVSLEDFLQGVWSWTKS